jgi:KDO2-lipid IV(A) lauroyltransferase
MQTRLKHRIEYILLRAAIAPLRRLPYRLALLFAWCMAWFTHNIVRFRVKEARRRIRIVLGSGITQRRVRRIAWISWRNLCFNIVDTVKLPRMGEDEFVRILTNYRTVIDKAISFHREIGGFVLATAHIGNWELGLPVAKATGLPLFAIARRQKNPLTDAYLNKLRHDTGIRVVMNDSSVLKNVIRELRKDNVLAILPDVRARTQALDIEFLGDHANIGGGMALFARQTKMPILPVFSIRQGWGHHRWTLLDPIYPDENIEKKEDWRRMTQIVMDKFSAVILENPEQYFWYNKRWVLEPLEDHD